MSTVVVMTALDLEFEAVRQYLRAVRTLAHPAGTLFEVGELPRIPGKVCLAVTGEGNISAAVTAERAAAMFQPQALLCTGVAGGLRSDIALGDVVVATKVYAFHSGREHHDGFLARPRAWHASHELEQLARQTARTRTWTRLVHEPGCPQAPSTWPPRVHFKPIASGEVVLTATGTPLVSWLHDSYDDAAAIEMESAGIAHAAHLNRSIPSLTIRSVSDHADALKHDTDMAGWQRVAAENAAAFTVALIARFLASPNTIPSTYRDQCRRGHTGAPATLAHQELV